MKKLIKTSLVSIGVALVMASHSAFAEDLSQVYQAAIKNDQTYANAVATEKDTAQSSPQALALLFPHIGFTGSGTFSKTNNSGSAVVTKGDTVSRVYEYQLGLSQDIFNFADWTKLASAHNNVKAAYATLSAAEQALIVSVTTDYFDVLEKEDVLRYTEAEKRALYEKYQQAEESFKVGVKTITDVYQAKAAYDGSVSDYIKAENNLETSFETLSVITGTVYQHLKPLGQDFPLVKPTPSNIQSWVHSTQTNNWQIIADRYSMFAAKDDIKTQWSGHLPVLTGSVDYTKTITQTLPREAANTNTQAKGPSAALNLTVPLFNDGPGSSTYVSSLVRQYIAKYEEAATNFELTYRQQTEQARSSYLNVVSGMSKVEADRRLIISDRSSLLGTEEGYKVGTQTMTDVLDQEKQLYSDLSTYAADRYQYVNDAIALKQAAGTLSAKDITALNSWLSYPDPKNPSPYDVQPSDVKPGSLKQMPKLSLPKMEPLR